MALLFKAALFRYVRIQIAPSARQRATRFPCSEAASPVVSGQMLINMHIWGCHRTEVAIPGVHPDKMPGLVHGAELNEGCRGTISQ